MTRRRLQPGAFLVLWTLAFTAVADAAPPARIDNLVTRLQFTPQDQSRIRDYAQYWCRQLRHGDPAEVKSIRQNLLDPLRKPGGVSEPFRIEYSHATLDELETSVRDGDPLQAINALLVIGALGTPDALEVMLEHCDVTDEARFGVRLWAAKGMAMAFGQGSLRATDVNQALRRVKLASARETAPLVMRRQFELVASVNTVVSRDILMEMLADVTERMTKDGSAPNEFMGAVFPALKLLRDQFIALPQSETKEIGKELAPTLVQICDLAKAHWDKAQESPLKDDYGGAVFISEILLTMISEQDFGRGRADVRTALGEAWKRRDKPRFEEDHKKWEGFVKQPPFGR